MDDDQSGRADQLAARFAIMDVKAKYFRFIDSKNWEGLRELFVPDAVVDMRDAFARMKEHGFSGLDGDGIMRGRDAFVALNSSVEGVTTVHHGHMPEIEFQSPIDATLIVAMEDVVRQADEHGQTREMHGYGHYHDRFVCDESGRWRIASLRITRLYVTMT